MHDPNETPFDERQREAKEARQHGKKERARTESAETSFLDWEALETAEKKKQGTTQLSRPTNITPNN